MTLIDQIRDLIAEGETQRSLDELYKYVKESNADVIDHLVMLRSRMQNLQRAVSNGTMDEQDAAMERAKINEAILKLLPQLTPEYLAEASKRREPARPSAAFEASAPAAPARDMKKMYLIGGGILLVVVLLIAMLSGGGDSEEGQQQIATETHSSTIEWQSKDGSVAFITQDGIYWDEMDGDVAKFRFTKKNETSEYVEIYDAARQITLRLYDTEAQFQNEGESEWNVLVYGGWKE